MHSKDKSWEGKGSSLDKGIFSEFLSTYYQTTKAEEHWNW